MHIVGRCSDEVRPRPVLAARDAPTRGNSGIGLWMDGPSPDFYRVVCPRRDLPLQGKVTFNMLIIAVSPNGHDRSALVLAGQIVGLSRRAL
jgi:hypothetical protein